MTLLLLIRHGENDFTKKHRLAGRLPKVHLNERGREQAARLAQALKDVPISAVYSSPLDRARETAAPIARALNLATRIEPGLIETDVGKWQGRSIGSLRLNKQWRIVQNSPSRAQFPEGETFHECQSRVVATLERLIHKRNTREIVLCVFHADPIKLAVAYFLGMPLDHFQRLGCETGSLTALKMGESSSSLIKLNQHPPFEFLHSSRK